MRFRVDSREELGYEGSREFGSMGIPASALFVDRLGWSDSCFIFVWRTTPHAIICDPGPWPLEVLCLLPTGLGAIRGVL